MGYYSSFEVNVSRFNEKNSLSNGLNCAPTDGVWKKIPKDIISHIETEMEIMNVFEDISSDDDSISCYAYAKWYDCDKDMCILSSKFPGVLFSVHAEGEESSDLWNAYFLNGMFQLCRAQIVYDDFNPKKMISSINLINNEERRYSYQSVN